MSYCFDNYKSRIKGIQNISLEIETSIRQVERELNSNISKIDHLGKRRQLQGVDEKIRKLSSLVERVKVVNQQQLGFTETARKLSLRVISFSAVVVMTYSLVTTRSLSALAAVCMGGVVVAEMIALKRKLFRDRAVTILNEQQKIIKSYKEKAGALNKLVNINKKHFSKSAFRRVQVQKRPAIAASLCVDCSDSSGEVDGSPRPNSGPSSDD